MDRAPHRTVRREDAAPSPSSAPLTPYPEASTEASSPSWIGASPWMRRERRAGELGERDVAEGWMRESDGSELRDGASPSERRTIEAPRFFPAVALRGRAGRRCRDRSATTRDRPPWDRREPRRGRSRLPRRMPSDASGCPSRERMRQRVQVGWRERCGCQSGLVGRVGTAGARRGKRARWTTSSGQSSGATTLATCRPSSRISGVVTSVAYADTPLRASSEAISVT